MKFRIKVRRSHEQDVLATHEFEGWMVGHDEIMEATGGNPFYSRGTVMVDSDGAIIQYIRIKKDIA